MEEYINITLDNIDQEHICCAISDKKHFEGVFNKKEWLKKRITEGHVFRKLNVQGKVFVEYAPLEKAWVPIEGTGFLYIYCLWVSGKFKGHGQTPQDAYQCYTVSYLTAPLKTAYGHSAPDAAIPTTSGNKKCLLPMRQAICQQAPSSP